MGIQKKQKPKGKGKGVAKMVTKEEKRDTFFTFFTPPDVSHDEKKDHDDDEVGEAVALLNEDFDIGLNIKEKLISKAVLYFAGEADDIDIDEDFDDMESDDDDDDEEED